MRRKSHHLFGRRRGSAALIAGVTVGAASHAAIAFDAATPIRAAAEAGHYIHGTVAYGYSLAPALTLVLFFAILFPVLTITARMFAQTRNAKATAEQLRARYSEDVVAGSIEGDSESAGGQAFIEVVGETQRFAILNDMLRIGREADNDIRIRIRGVHCYHAAIHREDFAEWRITDLSGPGGIGVMVNGKPCGDAKLRDGDVIELGPGRLRFRSGPA